jgi:putative transcriptional regulator
MTKYHPDTRFISDFAAGSLPMSQALCVSAHLHYCDDCKQKVAQLTDLGSTLFDKSAPVSLDLDFSSLMERIDSIPEENDHVISGDISSSPNAAISSLPEALNKLTNNNLKSLNWRRIGKTFSYSEFNIGDPLRETSLFNIKAGGNVPKHVHEGDEITVVLKGSFSDQDDHYQVGDFIVRTSGEIHTPVAAQDEDCLCLSTLDAPIKMTNWFYRLLIPFASRTTQTA